MKIKMQSFKRIAYVAVAFILAFIGTTESVLVGRVFADAPVGGQIQQRFIRMSDSGAGKTGADYLVSFKPATNHTITGMVIQFCDSSSTPLITDTSCTAPFGFSVSGITVNSTPGESVPDGLGGFTTLTDLGGTWAVDAGTTASILKITSSGVAVTTANRYAFTVQGVSNPSATGTFYARLITYIGSTTTGTDFANYTTGVPNQTSGTSATDYGGFALSTANVISVTARVAESMIFCVSGDKDYTDPTDQPPDANCTNTAAPNLTLGHGTNDILDSSAIDTTPAWMQLSTNANGGAVMRMRNTSTSGGLNFGSNSIPAVNSGSATASAITAGTAAFGLHINNSTTVTGATAASGTVTPDANYTNGTNDSNTYGMDTTSASGGNVTTTYGDIIATAAGPVNNVQNKLIFGATASNTTPAGIYTANILVVATGTY